MSVPNNEKPSGSWNYRAALMKRETRMITSHFTAKGIPMSKKHNPNPHERTRLVTVEKRAREREREREREPQPQPQPSDLARLRGATVAQAQREARARREMLAYLEREDARRDAICTSVIDDEDDDFQPRRRPLGEPMATRIGEIPDPLACMAWESIVADTAATVGGLERKWPVVLALATWSAACFYLGMLAR